MLDPKKRKPMRQVCGLDVHKDYPNGWTKESIKEHGKKMYKLLEESFY